MTDKEDNEAWKWRREVESEEVERGKGKTEKEGYSGLLLEKLEK